MMSRWIAESGVTTYNTVSVLPGYTRRTEPLISTHFILFFLVIALFLWISWVLMLSSISIASSYTIIHIISFTQSWCRCWDRETRYGYNLKSSLCGSRQAAISRNDQIEFSPGDCKEPLVSSFGALQFGLRIFFWLFKDLWPRLRVGKLKSRFIALRALNALYPLFLGSGKGQCCWVGFWRVENPG